MADALPDAGRQMSDAASGALSAALAGAPILLILALMFGLRWSAARAGAAGLAVAAVLALTVFDFRSQAAAIAAVHVGGVFAEGAFTSLTILWILWPALALHHHQQQCGALDAMRGGLSRLSGARPVQVLLVGWFLALFFEGAAGFGTPVALTAPILVGLGIAPVQAVVLALLGHAGGVSFGALGTPVLAQAALSGLDAVQIAWRIAVLHAAVGGVLMLFFARALAAAGSGAGAPQHAALSAAPAALAAAGFFLPSLLLAWWLGPELATLGGALVGGALLVAALRWRSSGAGPNTPGTASGVLRALWPYALLVTLVIVTRVLPPMAELLRSVHIDWHWAGQYSGRMQPLAHPGTLLLLALVAGARLQGVPLRSVGSSLAHAARQLVPVTLALLAMLCLSRLMLHAGMIDALQRAAVGRIGEAWPLVAPAVGALGSFITGSATASNVLFTSLQVQTAQGLGLPVLWMASAQGFGAAIGNIVCPHNIVAGAATVGLAGREGHILRQTLLPCLVYLLLGGILVAAIALR